MRCLLNSLLALGCLHAAVSFALTATPTNTSLTIEPGSAVAGTPVTLTAVVTGTSVSAGFVEFCNADASYCEDSDLLATATGVKVSATQLVATTTLRMTVGVHDINAVFLPTSANQSSTSLVQTLTVTPPPIYQSSTTLSAIGSAGNYSLAGTVTSFGSQSLVGSLLRFRDKSNNGTEIGTASIGSSDWAFTPPDYLGPGLTSAFSAVADLNHDGIPDVISLNHDPVTGIVSVTLGNGDRTFQAKSDYSVGALASYVTVGDVNGDGKPDVIAVGGGAVAGWIAVLLGNGDGTLQPSVSYNIGSDPRYVAIGDFNGDGRVDAAVLRSPSAVGILSILLNQGDGTFQQTDYPVDQTPVSLAIGDFDRDGHLDLAVAYNVAAEMSVLRGNGDGTFQPKVDYATSTASNCVAIGDFNRDGYQDLVTNDSNSSIAVFLGNGDGTFRPKIGFPANRPAEWFAVGDFNADGKLDIAFSNGGTATVSFMTGNGDGTFQPKVDLTGWLSSYVISAADLNSDGIADIIGGDFGGLFALYGEQVGHYSADGISVVGGGSHQVIASFSGDDSRLGSQSTAVSLTASKAATSISLSTSGSPVQFRESVTLVATVSEVQNVTATGSVAFMDGGTLIGTAPLVSGTASITTSSLAVGSHTISAVYGGDQDYVGITSSNLNQAVSKASAKLNVVSSVNPSVFGSRLTFTATVAPGATGTITFLEGPTVLGAAIVNSGTAELTISTLTAGTHSITAIYSGDNNYQ